MNGCFLSIVIFGVEGSYERKLRLVVTYLSLLNDKILLRMGPSDLTRPGSTPGARAEYRLADQPKTLTDQLISHATLMVTF